MLAFETDGRATDYLNQLVEAVVDGQYSRVAELVELLAGCAADGKLPADVRDLAAASAVYAKERELEAARARVNESPSMTPVARADVPGNVVYLLSADHVVPDAIRVFFREDEAERALSQINDLNRGLNGELAIYPIKVWA
jgi:hypothetical protein